MRQRKHPSQPRPLTQVLTTRGIRSIPVNKGAADIVFNHWMAVIIYLYTGGTGPLANLDEWKQFTDGEDIITLETDPQAIEGYRPFVANKMSAIEAEMLGLETARQSRP